MGAAVRRVPSACGRGVVSGSAASVRNTCLAQVVCVACQERERERLELVGSERAGVVFKSGLESTA